MMSLQQIPTDAGVAAAVGKLIMEYEKTNNTVRL